MVESAWYGERRCGVRLRNRSNSNRGRYEEKKKILFTFFVAACSLLLRAADVVEVTADGKEAVRYAAIEDALGACSGGETLTLLGDVAVPGKLEVSKSVTVDLAGYTLKNDSGWFICPTEEVGTLSFRNGTLTSADACFAFGDGAYTVSVSNVVLGGNTILYAYRQGSGGTLEILEDCRAAARIRFVTFASSAVGGRCVVRGGVVLGKIYEDTKYVGNRLEVCGGSFVQDPSAVLAPGYVAEEGTHEVQGVTCHYRVRAANDDDAKGVATVTCADGVVRGCASLDMALASCAPGGTVTLLEDCTAAFPIALDKAMTLDLNGHALCRSGSGALFAPPTGAAGMTVRNGRCEAADVLLAAEAGTVAGTTTFADCTLKAQTLFRGRYLDVALADCRAEASFFFAAGSVGTVAVSDGAYAVTEARHTGRTARARVAATGGRFNFDVSDGLPDGYAQICEDAVVEGLVCRYAVYPEGEANVLQPHVALVLAADGSTVNGYPTVAEAIAACPDGGRVKMLKSCTVDAALLEIPRSMTLDLNGLTFANATGDFLKIPAGVTLEVDGGGGLLNGSGSVFHMSGNAAAVVNVTNCTLKGLCTLYGSASAVVNLQAGTSVQTDLFASGNGFATLNVRGGHHAFASSWGDQNATDPNQGTRIHLFGGHFERNPLATSLAHPPALSEGTTAFYEDGRTFRGFSTPYAVYPDAGTTAWTREAVHAGLVHTNVNAALRVAQATGGTVRLLSDIAHTVDLADGAGEPLTLAFDGHRIVGSAGDAPSCGLHLTGANAAWTLDGASVATTYLVNWDAGGKGTSLEVTGDGTNTCTDVLVPGTAIPETGLLTIRGGWWALDPTPYVTNNHVVLQRTGVTPCPWRVRDWTKLTAEGWNFDLDDPLLGATATGTVEAATVEVTLTGTVPVRRTLLADLSGVSVTGGAVKFVPSPDLPHDVKIVFENGRLFAWQATGTLLVFR